MPNILAGISYPFRVEGAGLPAQAFGTDVVRSALVMLLRTNRRSRVMRPELGPDLLSLIFEVNSPALADIIRREILTAVGNELPMVNIVKIDVYDDSKVVRVNVLYVIQGVIDETGEVLIGSRT